MAKGNIGNLFQHFVALKCAERLAHAWGMPDSPVEYIDCYSMAPWETITGQNGQGFSQQINRFGDLSDRGDSVASTFTRAWERRYSVEAMPAEPRKRLYPNSAELLVTAMPEQRWSMRLHDKDQGVRDQLLLWANRLPQIDAKVAGQWSTSELLLHQPADPTRPLFLMLDPYRVTSGTDTEEKRGVGVENGYLPIHWLRALLGKHFLDLNSQVRGSRKAPVVITLFSYSDTDPNGLAREIKSLFPSSDWSIDFVRTGPHPGQPPEQYHRGWIISHGLPTVAPDMQSLWNAWT